MSRATAALAIFVALALAGCSTSRGVVVELDEYTVSLEQRLAAAGDVTFTARNEGSIAHQLLVLRTRLGVDDLPVEDGVVEIDGQRVREVGEIDLISPDATRSLTVDLAPGAYVLICNIAGHYDNGMRTPFRVPAATEGPS